MDPQVETKSSNTWRNYLVWGAKGLAAVTGATLAYGLIRSVWRGGSDAQENSEMLRVYERNDAFVGGVSNGVELLQDSVTLLPVCGDEWQVNQYTQNIQYSPSVASLDNERLAVSWHSDGQDGSREGVYAQVFSSDGIALGNEWRVNRYTENSQYYPSLVALGSERLAVSWQSLGQGGSTSGIYARVFWVNGTALTDEWQVSQYQYAQSLQISPNIIALDTERLVVSWHSNGQEGSGWDVYARVFWVNGTALTDEWRVNQYMQGAQQFSSMVALDSERLAMSWMSAGGEDQEGSGWDVYARVFWVNGAALGDEWRVNHYKQNHQWHPSLVALDAERLAVSWASDGQDDSSYDIYARVFSSNGTALTDEWRVNQHRQSDQQHPSLIVLAAERLAVSWDSLAQDGSEEGVYARVFSSNGAALTDEWRVNQYKQSKQWYPSLVALGSRRLAVNWASLGQDGSSYGVYARVCELFNSATPVPSPGPTPVPSPLETPMPSPAPTPNSSLSTTPISTPKVTPLSSFSSTGTGRDIQVSSEEESTSTTSVWSRASSTFFDIESSSKHSEKTPQTTRFMDATGSGNKGTGSGSQEGLLLGIGIGIGIGSLVILSCAALGFLGCRYRSHHRQEGRRHVELIVVREGTDREGARGEDEAPGRGMNL